MQQAIYKNFSTHVNSSISSPQTVQALTPSVSAVARTRRHLALKWDLYGVLTLIATCTSYSAFALAHAA